MDRNKYLPGIDGLRAIAVMAVIMFHGQFSKFPGGFVGVDVFFVISGFLITRLIASEVERTGRLDFASFYARRARRLFPALFVVLSLSFGVAFLFFTAHDFRNFGEDMVYSLVSLSNFNFWAQSGYFGTASQLKPLLHTWSLGVEEQFYLIWPIAIAFALRKAGRRGILIAIAMAAIASLAANAWMLDPTHTADLTRIDPMLASWFKDGPSSIFYLTPFRIFEFSIGATLVWVKAPRSNVAIEILFAVGMALIAYAIRYFVDTMAFPSYSALVPCAGAALIILASNARALGLIVRNPAAVFIGKISYSVYLVHWPLMVFYRYWRFEPLDRTERCALVVTSIVLGYLLYRFVETPVRSGRLFPRLTAPAIGFACTALIVVALLPAASAAAHNGWVWRINAHAAKIQDDGTNQLDDIVGRLGCSIYCEFGNPAGPKVLLVGDSHSDQYSRTLKRIAGGRYHFYQVYSPSCFFGKTMTSWPNASLGPGCLEANDRLHELLQTTAFDAVIIGERWPGYRDILVKGGEHLTFKSVDDLYPKMLDDIGSLFAGFKGALVIVGHAPNTNTSCYKRPQFFRMDCPTLSLYENKSFARAVKAFSERSALNISFVNPVDDVCPGGDCRITDDHGRILYTDAIHLSIFGASLVVPRIVADLPGKFDAKTIPITASAHYPPR